MSWSWLSSEQAVQYFTSFVKHPSCRNVSLSLCQYNIISSFNGWLQHLNWSFGEEGCWVDMCPPARMKQHLWMQTRTLVASYLGCFQEVILSAEASSSSSEKSNVSYISDLGAPIFTNTLIIWACVDLSLKLATVHYSSVRAVEVLKWVSGSNNDEAAALTVKVSHCIPCSILRLLSCIPKGSRKRPPLNIRIHLNGSSSAISRVPCGQLDGSQITGEQITLIGTISGGEKCALWAPSKGLCSLPKSLPLPKAGRPWQQRAWTASRGRNSSTHPKTMIRFKSISPNVERPQRQHKFLTGKRNFFKTALIHMAGTRASPSLAAHPSLSRYHSPYEQGLKWHAVKSW